MEIDSGFFFFLERESARVYIGVFFRGYFFWLVVFVFQVDFWAPLIFEVLVWVVRCANKG